MVSFKISKCTISLFVAEVYVLANDCDTATEVVKSVNILIAISWVAQAWEYIKSETVTERTGILGNAMDVVHVKVLKGMIMTLLWNLRSIRRFRIFLTKL